MYKPHAHFQTMNKTLAKFQADQKTIIGVLQKLTMFTS